MSQAPRIPPALWEAQRLRITELYVNQDKTLDEVIQIMTESGFHTTKPQYIRKINVNWKLQKNYTREKWQHASALVTKREAEGKITQLSIDGKVISEKRRKKELRRYHVPQVDEDFVTTSAYGVVAFTPPLSNSRAVLVNGLPWMKFRESFNSLIKSQPPLFGPNQQNGSLGFWEVANTLLSGVHATGEMATGSLPPPEPPRPVSDQVSRYLEIESQRLFELVPMLDNSMKILPCEEPPWLHIFNSLVFLCSNNLTGTKSSTYAILQVAISSGFLIKMKHLLTKRGPTVEIFAVHLLFAALGVKGSKGRGFMRFLLESGVSPNSVDPNDYRYSALHRAVRLEDDAAVQLLLHFGADPDAKNKETLGSPLSHAATLHHGGTIVDMLIDARADPNYGPAKPLIQAAIKFNLKLVRRLLRAGANPRLLPIGGLSMIYFAIGQGDLNLVNMLIEAGAS